MNRSTVFI